MTDPRRGNWCQTFQGVQFWPLGPRVQEIRIGDIAHALALKCRYNGHCDYFYSVAQHSVLVSQKVPAESALWGLLHDASEAYLVDMPRPLKVLPEFGWYREMEALMQNTICKRFELPLDEPASVKLSDGRWLMTEKRDIVGPPPAKWEAPQGLPLDPYDDEVVPWPWQQAEQTFLDRFFELAPPEEAVRYVRETMASMLRLGANPDVDVRVQRSITRSALEELVRRRGATDIKWDGDVLHFLLPAPRTVSAQIDLDVPFLAP